MKKKIVFLAIIAVLYCFCLVPGVRGGGLGVGGGVIDIILRVKMSLSYYYYYYYVCYVSGPYRCTHTGVYGFEVVFCLYLHGF